MKTISIILIILGAIIFISVILGGGLLYSIPIPYYPYFGWFIGIILVALGLWFNGKK